MNKDSDSSCNSPTTQDRVAYLSHQQVYPEIKDSIGPILLSDFLNVRFPLCSKTREKRPSEVFFITFEWVYTSIQWRILVDDVKDAIQTKKATAMKMVLSNPLGSIIVLSTKSHTN